MTVVRTLMQAVSRLTPRMLGLGALALLVGAVTAGAAAAAVAPSNTALPVVSGTVSVGSTLAASTGTWSGDAPIAFVYQWQKCDATPSVCGNIAGATAATYVPIASDAGGRLLAAVTGTNAAGSATAFSAPTGVIPAVAAPGTATLPTISGSAMIGSTLAGATGTWTGTQPIGSVSTWLRCDAAGQQCTAISGAATLSYVLVQADLGSTIRLSVTGTNSAGSATAVSVATSVIAARPETTPPPRSRCDRRGHGRHLGWLVSKSHRSCPAPVDAQDGDKGGRKHDDQSGDVTLAQLSSPGQSGDEHGHHGRGHDKHDKHDK